MISDLFSVWSLVSRGLSSAVIPDELEHRLSRREGWTFFINRVYYSTLKCNVKSDEEHLARVLLTPVSLPRYKHKTAL